MLGILSKGFAHFSIHWKRGERGKLLGKYQALGKYFRSIKKEPGNNWENIIKEPGICEKGTGKVPESIRKVSFNDRLTPL